VTYRARSKDAWSGALSSNRVQLTVTGAPASDRCSTNPGWRWF